MRHPLHKEKLFLDQNKVDKFVQNYVSLQRTKLSYDHYRDVESVVFTIVLIF